MSAESQAVFLSYASQDAEAVKKIADALRAAGVEVWFDQNELVGGDAWDAKIRKQIAACALFIPVISANTQARLEGYFRIEWRLAAQRTHAMAEEKAFLLPVVIDATRDTDAKVPAEFKLVQWMHLGLHGPSPSFVSRVQGLLGGAPAVSAKAPGQPVAPAPLVGAARPGPTGRRRRVVAAVLAVLALAAVLFYLAQCRRPANPSSPATPAAADAKPEARVLLDRMWAIYDRMDDGTAEEWAAGLQIGERLRAQDPLNAEIWAACSSLESLYPIFGLEGEHDHRLRATQAAERAVALAPESVDARLALANVRRLGTATAQTEAVGLARRLAAEQPANRRVQRTAGNVFKSAGLYDEALRCYDRASALPGGDPVSLLSKADALMRMGNYAESRAVTNRSQELNPGSGALLRRAVNALMIDNNLEAAAAIVRDLPASALQGEMGVQLATAIALYQHDPDQCREALARLPGNKLRGEPKGLYQGSAYRAAGRLAAARAEWEQVLRDAQSDLATRPNDVDAIFFRAMALALLGRTAEATADYETLRQMNREDSRTWRARSGRLLLELGRKQEAIRDLAASLKGVTGLSLLTRYANLRRDPDFDRLRGEPEFEALLAEIDRDLPSAKPLPGPVRTATNAVPSAPADDKSVAVLAFANLSDDKSNEYFSDGISEELLNVLAKVPGLKVTARTSAFYFKGKEVPIPEIARQLGVAYVVEGSVRKAGDKVRITAQLIKADGGFHVWSETFTRDLKDIFAVQDEIAALVAKNLELKMGITAARPAVDLEAYQEYLAGKAAYAKAGMAELREAVTHLERAVEIDPKFAPAWIQLASTYTRLGRWGGLPTIRAWAAARTAIDRARALDPDSPDMLVALGWIQRTGEWDWAGAEQSFRRAMRLRPGHADTLAAAAVLLFNVGQGEEAFRLGQQAAQLDPLNAGTQIDLALMFHFNGNWAESERACRRALALAPNGVSYHSVLAWNLMQQGRYAEAEQEIAREADATERFCAAGLIALRRGDRATARRCLDELEALARINPDSADLQTSITWISAALGDKDRAFAAMAQARTSRDPSISWLRNGSYADALRDDPRWPAFLRSVGLADDQLGK